MEIEWKNHEEVLFEELIIEFCRTGETQVLSSKYFSEYWVGWIKINLVKRHLIKTVRHWRCIQKKRERERLPWQLYW